MPRTQQNSKKGSKTRTKKDRPPKARSKVIKVANVELRRSQRQTSSRFATQRITANRLSLPLNFLDRGFKSQVIRKKKPSTPVITQRGRHLLNEDLHALLQPVENFNENNDFEGPPKKRATLSSQNQFLNASSYYLSVITNQATTEPDRTDVEISRADTIDLTDTSVDLKKDQVNHLENEIDVTSILETTLTDINRTSNHSFNKTSIGLAIKTYHKDTSLLETSLSERYRPVNYRFCHNVFERITIKLRSSKRDCVLKLKKDIAKINDILDGKRSPSSSPKPNMSIKRQADEEYDKTLSKKKPLVPKSQWVYSTPDKQNMKEFVFEDTSDKIIPAVIRTSKKTKVLYDIKNEVAQHINLNKFNGQNVIIDRRYLKTICENSIEDVTLSKPSKKQRIDSESDKENVFSFVVPKPKSSEFVFEPKMIESNNVKEDFNLFLSGDTEECIDIHDEIQRGNDCAMDMSFEEVPMNEGVENMLCDEEKCQNFDFQKCRSALPKDLHNFESDPYETAPIDYRHQLLMATQRPAKTTRKIQKRHLLKAKSLSFENTPPGAKTAVFSPKRLEMSRSMEEECIDHFEREFCSLNDTSFNNLMNVPHTVTSGALEYDEDNQMDLKAFNENVKTMFKFYPRRNFDPE